MRTLRLLSIAGLAMVIDAAPASSGALVDRFLKTLPPAINQVGDVSLPAVGCPRDGQVGEMPPEALPETVNVRVSAEVASRLAFYSATGAEAGVVAPRGWHCFETYGSAGSGLYVVPFKSKAPILDRRDRIGGGPAVVLGLRFGSTSGRYSVARIAARMFPHAHPFIEQVRDFERSLWEGMAPPKGGYQMKLVFSPWRSDSFSRLSDEVLTYVTPRGKKGLGTEWLEPSAELPVSGVLFIDEDDDFNLEHLSIRLSRVDQDLAPSIILARLAAISAKLDSWYRPAEKVR